MTHEQAFAWFEWDQGPYAVIGVPTASRIAVVQRMEVCESDIVAQNS